LAIGIGLVVYGMGKIGIVLTIVSATMASVAYFMAQYAHLVAIAGGVILFCIIGCLGYVVVTNRKALIESLTCFEITKNKTWTEDTKNEVNTIQSNKTKKVIRELKHKENIG
jgi:hypothetical protein